MTGTLSPLVTGFAVTISLIVAVGAQNTWVLNKALRNQHPWTIAAVCIAIDISLMSVGVFTLDFIQQVIPGLVPVLTWMGIGLLIYLALQAFFRAWQGDGDGLATASVMPTGSAWRMAGQALAISLINPHVYLDTVILIGSVGAQQSQPVLFILGAGLASATWFCSLVAGAKKLRPYLTSAHHWRVMDTITGSVLLLVAMSLLP
ncbi:lysine transporter LysE [Bacterioplanes sanyensis]|uniref:Lysine transporter LysE n=1 Tax=Bacterioplanes sanyensis TaxID=1249553 RepID=A0A222FH49_9GAMM|nr:LysE family transporter [Bacterioplanes sanyensis]ASP38089.1 lysine transporter LysE [Bacterioplanes sanyensis]